MYYLPRFHIKISLFSLEKQLILMAYQVRLDLLQSYFLSFTQFDWLEWMNSEMLFEMKMDFASFVSLENQESLVSTYSWIIHNVILKLCNTLYLLNTKISIGPWPLTFKKLLAFELSYNADYLLGFWFCEVSCLQ